MNKKEIKGKTEGGFEFEIRANLTDDFEFLEALTAYFDDPTVANFIAVKNALFEGHEDVEKAAKQWVKDRNSDGICSTNEFAMLVLDIFNSVRSLKN